MKKFAKIAVALLMAFTLVFSFASCASQEEKDVKAVQKTVEKGFDSLIKYNEKKTKKYFNSEYLKVLRDAGEFVPNTEDIADALFSKLTYEIVEVKVDDDPVDTDYEKTATVTIKLTNKDLMSAAGKYSFEIIPKIQKKEVNLADDKFLESEVKRIVDKMNAEDVQTTFATTDLTVNKKKGEDWKIELDGKAEAIVFCTAKTSMSRLFSYVKQAKEGTLNFGTPSQTTTTQPTTQSTTQATQPAQSSSAPSSSNTAA